MNGYIGQRVRVTAGPSAGHVGVVTGVKTLPARENAPMTGEFRIEFKPPIHLPSVGFLTAVWRRPTEFTVVKSS